MFIIHDYRMHFLLHICNSLLKFQDPQDHYLGTIPEQAHKECATEIKVLNKQDNYIQIEEASTSTAEIEVLDTQPDLIPIEDSDSKAVSEITVLSKQTEFILIEEKDSGAVVESISEETKEADGTSGLPDNSSDSVVQDASISSEQLPPDHLQPNIVQKQDTEISGLLKHPTKSIQHLCATTACQTLEGIESGETNEVIKNMTDEIHELRKENSNLKLELNAAQQAKASLELEIRQKEEVIIKTQAEAINTEETFKLEIKQLKEKLKENSEIIDKSSTKILEQQLKEAKEKEAKAASELNQRNKDVLNYQ